VNTMPRALQDKPRPKPETLIQAANWQKHKARYLDSGLCDPCAAQAAWGHQKQVGRARVRPLCDQCVTVFGQLSQGHSARPCSGLEHGPRDTGG
jgi:hypothetical protein